MDIPHASRGAPRIMPSPAPLAVPSLAAASASGVAILLALLLPSGPAGAASPARPSAAERPNIIVIIADDLGIPDLGTYGLSKEAVPTPNLDRLARRGVTFTRGYATASVCSPSRAALLTGQYQQRHGFEFLTPENADAGNQGLTPGQRVFAADLKATGYRTAIIGKWHLGATPDRLPTARGFDQFFGFLPGETAYIRGGTPGTTSVRAPYLGDRSFTRKVDWVQLMRDRAGDAAPPVVEPDRRQFGPIGERTVDGDAAFAARQHQHLRQQHRRRLLLRRRRLRGALRLPAGRPLGGERRRCGRGRHHASERQRILRILR